MFREHPIRLSTSAMLALFLISTWLWLAAAGLLLPHADNQLFVGLAITGVCFAAPTLVAIIFRGRGQIKQSFALPHGRQLAGIVILAVTTWVVVLMATSWLVHLDKVEQAQNELTRVVRETDTPRIYVILSLALLPALGEEIMFRGLLLGLLVRIMPTWSAILVSSIFFGAYHYNLAQLAPATLLGIAFALVLLRTGSLLAPMLMHGLSNAVVASVALYSGQNELAAYWATVLIPVNAVAWWWFWLRSRPPATWTTAQPRSTRHVK